MIQIYRRRPCCKIVCSILLVIVAFVPRLIGINWGLPRIYHPDEPNYVNTVLTMLQTGDLNPRWFNYPSLFLYLLIPGVIFVFIGGVASGAFVRIEDLASARMVVLGTGTTDIPLVYTTGRLEMTACGLLTIYLIYKLGYEMFDRRTATVASTLLALAPVHILASHYYRPDALVTLMATASVYASFRVYCFARLGDYLVAGLLVGLTATSKYNGGVVILALWGAQLLRGGAPLDIRLWLGTVMAGVGFLAGTPFALLDMPNWLNGMAWEVRHYYVLGHAGAEGEVSGLWYIRKLFSTTGLVPILALVDFGVEGIKIKNRATTLLAIFPVAYFALIATARVHTTIALTPLLPLLSLLAARGFVLLLAWIKRKNAKGLILNALGMFSLLALIMVPFIQTIHTAYQFAQPEIRTVAEEWLKEHLPARARIAAESYTPLLSDYFEVTYLPRLIDYSPEWYIANRFDYLVASSATYGRYYASAGTGKYKNEILAYDQIFERFTLIAKIQGPFQFLAEPSGEIRCYRVR